MNPKEQIRQWWIYKITSPTGRIYIGKTKVLKNRLNQYRTGAHKNNNMPICRSINKYGWDAHKFEIIEELLCDLNYANNREIFWIESYMCNVYKYPDSNGLNLTNGGDGSAGFKHTEEWKLKCSKLHKGKQHLLGFKFSEESLRKRSISQKGQKLNPIKVAVRTQKLITAIGRPIIMLNDDGNIIKEYGTVTEAIKKSGASKVEMYRVLSGSKNKTKGMIFKYK